MWNKILEELEKTDKGIKTFIDSLSPEEQTRERITIKCKSELAFNFLKKGKYLSKIEKIAKTLFDENTEVKFIVAPDNDENTANESLQLEFNFKKEENSRNDKDKENAENYEKFKDFTFDNFVLGPSNESVYYAAQTIAKNPGTGYNPFFIYGDSGLGKTHIVHAIGNYIIQNKRKKVYYSTAQQLMNDYVLALKTQTVMDLRKNILKNDVLLIDDIQFLSGKDRTQDEFFYIFNHFYENKKTIVITSDKHIYEISDINERLKSRFSMGVSLDIKPPEYETRIAIIKQKAELYEINIDDEAIDFIASNIRNNVREIEGALNNLKFCSGFIEKDVIDKKFAEKILKDKIKYKSSLEIEDIIKAVCSGMAIKPSEIVSKKRTKAVSLSRQIAIYLSRKYTSKTYKEIGEKFGGRDHSTVISSISNIEKLVLDDKDISKIVAKISKEIESLKGSL